MSSIVSDQYEFVIGVDTHAATHTYAQIAAATGAVLAIMSSSRQVRPDYLELRPG